MTTSELTDAIVDALKDNAAGYPAKASALACIPGAYALTEAKGVILAAYDSTPAYTPAISPVQMNEIVGTAREIKKTLRFVVQVGTKYPQDLDKLIDEIELKLTNRLAPGYRAFMPVTVTKLLEDAAATPKTYWRQIYFDTEARISPQIQRM